jgi:hypothetical protein
MYNKLFTKILDSSIWLESSPTRIVWMTLIAAMDEDGYAHFAALENLARRARVSIREAERAVACLEGPDKNSADPEHDGRRIERISGGWLVLNAEKHRLLVTRLINREQTRARVQKHRARNAAVTVSNGDVRYGNAPVTPSEAGSEAVSEYSSSLEGNLDTTAPAAADNGRPKAKPVFAGQRFVVFEWMLKDLRRLLGPHSDPFDLPAFFLWLDAHAEGVIPQRDKGVWLHAQVLDEAKRRNLPIDTGFRRKIVDRL